MEKPGQREAGGYERDAYLRGGERREALCSSCGGKVVAIYNIP